VKVIHFSQQLGHRTSMLGSTIRLLIVALGAVALTVSAQNQRQDFSKVEIKITPIAGNIHLLEGSGGNVTVSSGADGTLIVDTQFLPLAEKIDAALTALNPKPLQYVINTHVHGDHVGGNPYFGKKARIIATANLRQRLAAKTNAVPAELPVITFEQGLSLQFNGEEVRILAFQPGHTDGDAVVYFTKSKVLSFGDQFVNGRFPFVDIANGGNVKGYLKNIDSILAWLPADAKIVPGHGKLSSVADLKAERDFVAESIAVVEKDIAAGKTVDQIKANPEFLEKYKEWNNGGRWLEAVFKSLNAKQS